jgi:putative transposase
MLDQTKISCRRACRLVGLSRDSCIYAPVPDDQTRAVTAQIITIAHIRRRFGDRRVHDLLRLQFLNVNHKKVYRLYRENDLAVRKRKKAKRPINEQVPLQIACKPNEVWSMDFVSDSLAYGRRLRCLTVADDFSHESVEIALDYGISGAYVTRILDRAALFRGYPNAVKTDTVPSSQAVPLWLGPASITSGTF